MSGDAATLAVKGRALISNGGAFSEAPTVTQLAPGDHVLVRRGVAQIFVGEAEIAKGGAGSVLSLIQRDGALCAAHTSSAPSAPTTTGLSAGGVAIGLGFVGAIAGAGAALGSGGRQHNWWTAPAVSPLSQ